MSETDELGWDVDPSDEIASAVEVAGRLQKRWREARGLRVTEFAEAIGYGEDQVRKVERGVRIPRPEYLDKVDEVLGANGLIAAMKEDMRKARYPKKVRELAKLEEKAEELMFYCNHNLHGLLQTEEYMRALYGMRRPVLTRDQVEQEVTARLGRQSIYERSPEPSISFVLEEVTLLRPLGGKMVWRRQLERVLAVGELPNVQLQVMPTVIEEHAGMHGSIRLLKFADGTALGRSEGAFNGRPVSDPKQLRILELRYGMIRTQAPPPAESRVIIEEILGET